MDIIYSGLNARDFNRISTCKNVKEICHTLMATYEGTNQVNKSKINILVHKYELFKIDNSETISEMFYHFTNIINDLKDLGMNSLFEP